MEGRRKLPRIADWKIASIRTKFFNGTLIPSREAKEMRICVLTVRKYEEEFKIIKFKYPEEINNVNFWPPNPKYVFRQKKKILPYKLIEALRVRYFNGDADISQTAFEYNLWWGTVASYFREFKKIKDSYPEKISNKKFYAPREIAEHRETELYLGFLKVMPDLLKQFDGKPIVAQEFFKLYQEIYPEGYARTTFQHCFTRWCEQNNISRERFYLIKPEDIPVLEMWRKGNDHKLWQVSVSLLEGMRRGPMKVISDKIDVCRETMQQWYRMYCASGLNAFKRKIRESNEAKRNEIREREDNIIHLLHQSPKIFGINRTSWKYQDLVEVYLKQHGVKITVTNVSRDLRKRGYRTVKSREVLTSPDPNFREKYEAIQAILQNLGPKEKFFSIDEYGPFSIKIKGGRSMVKNGEFKTIPQVQKSKGWLICTAALELSTNQVTHFYSPKKNTAEMIKLLDVLINQYRDQDKLYLSWDMAGWHISKVLMRYVDVLNSDEVHKPLGIPYIGLAPLPASAQFLNVIESVFSGLAKSVIHHSNYQSVQECQEAITRYFEERNQHFKEHPHRAGKKIWGKELTPPHFDKANRCKTNNSLSTLQ